MTSGRIIILTGSPSPTGAHGAASHWQAIEGEPRYLTVDYRDDLDSAPVQRPDLVTSVWLGERVDNLPEQGDPAAARALLAVGQQAAPGYEEEFDAWLNEEHVPRLAKVTGCLSAHRYRSATGGGFHYAVYHLDDVSVTKSPQWSAASKTPLSDGMRPHSRNKVRGLYRRP